MKFCLKQTDASSAELCCETYKAFIRVDIWHYQHQTCGNWIFWVEYPQSCTETLSLQYFSLCLLSIKQKFALHYLLSVPAFEKSKCVQTTVKLLKMYPKGTTQAHCTGCLSFLLCSAVDGTVSFGQVFCLFSGSLHTWLHLAACPGTSGVS